MFFDRQYCCLYDMFSQERRGRSAGVRLGDKDADIEYPFTKTKPYQAAAEEGTSLCAPFRLSRLALSLLSLLLRIPLAPPPLLQPKKRLHPRTLAHFHVYMDRWIGASTHYTHIQMNAMISNDNNNSKDDDTTNQHKLH